MPRLEHFYQDIEGRFTWPAFYAWLASIAPQDARIVEIGTFYGCSAAFLGVEILNAWTRDGRPCSVKLDLVDIFDDTQIAATMNRLEPIASVLGTIHGCGSVEAAAKYDDDSLWTVFIDADHAYESVRDDIRAWLPKVKRGGFIAGHDFCADYPGVVRAVIESFDKLTIERGIPYKGPGEAGVVGPYFPVWWVQR